MRDILLTANRRILEHYASARVLLAFDFDGTLAPISPFRDEVAMRPQTRALLRRACASFPCAVITGRARADAMGRLRGIPLRHVVGNHGAETATGNPEAEAWASRTVRTLARSLQNCDGLEIEHKCCSISVHYRRAPSSARALRRIARSVEALQEPVRVIGGKYVVNLTPANVPHKGSALEAVACQEGVSHVIYVGDDQTDEDVFMYRGDAHLLGVRVGRQASSAARYFIRDQGSIDAFIEALVSCRTSSTSHGT